MYVAGRPQVWGVTAALHALTADGLSGEVELIDEGDEVRVEQDRLVQVAHLLCYLSGRINGVKIVFGTKVEHIEQVNFPVAQERVE